MAVPGFTLIGPICDSDLGEKYGGSKHQGGQKSTVIVFLIYLLRLCHQAMPDGRNMKSMAANFFFSVQCSLGFGTGHRKWREFFFLSLFFHGHEAAAVRSWCCAIKYLQVRFP